MKTTLFIVAHPHFNESVTTQHITQFLQSTSEAANGIISIRMLSELYPDGKINVTEEQKALLDEAINFRLQKQPFGFSAGSCFKNPSPENPAGKLIEEAGLKGHQIGIELTAQ